MATATVSPPANWAGNPRGNQSLIGGRAQRAFHRG
jgi:hypothetical protein